MHLRLPGTTKDIIFTFTTYALPLITTLILISEMLKRKKKS